LFPGDLLHSGKAPKAGSVLSAPCRLVWLNTFQNQISLHSANIAFIWKDPAKKVMSHITKIDFLTQQSKIHSILCSWTITFLRHTYLVIASYSIHTGM